MKNSSKEKVFNDFSDLRCLLPYDKARGGNSKKLVLSREEDVKATVVKTQEKVESNKCTKHRLSVTQRREEFASSIASVVNRYFPNYDILTAKINNLCKAAQYDRVIKLLREECQIYYSKCPYMGYWDFVRKWKQLRQEIMTLTREEQKKCCKNNGKRRHKPNVGKPGRSTPSPSSVWERMSLYGGIRGRIIYTNMGHKK